MSEYITRLDERTVERIAAGEVVERPASVVKELVENSLDADASRIDVAVTGNGTDHIEVADDGRGMSAADVRAAVQQHTTSKIGDIDDLTDGVGTLGFRGEALYTIGAVARMTVASRPRSGDGAGTELRMVGGEIESVEPTGRPPGTTVTVEDLFFNTPARRKYLKTDATEFGHVNRVVTRYALANPSVAVSLSHDGNRVFATTGQGDLREAMLAVYGRDVAESMISVEYEGAAAAVEGYVSDPETTRSAREYVSTYVNDRYVRDGDLRGAIVSAYGTQLAADRYPFAALFVEVPPERVDVNVHPRKMEVRFDEEDAVYDAVESAVEDALLDHGLVRTRAPRGRSAPEETPVEPATEDAHPSDPAESGTEGDGSTTATGPSESDRQSAGGADADEQEPTPDASDDTSDSVQEASDSAQEAPDSVQDSSAAGIAAESSRNSTADEPSHASTADEPSHASTADEPSHASTADEPSHASTADEPSHASTADEPSHASTADESHRESTAVDPDRKFDGALDQPSLTDVEATTGTDAGTSPETDVGPATDTDVEATTDFETLPPLRVLGQLQDTYVVAESPAGLVLVDQHAADERINYERLASRLATRRDSQTLVSPVEIELTAHEASVFEAALDEVRDLGFEARLDGRTALVEAVPAVLSDELDPSLLRDVLAGFLEQDGQDVVDSAADAIISDLACYPSITGNTSLSDGDVVSLLQRLDACENPFACPHGRPTLIEFSEEELEDRFERDYPGHQVRRPE
ncbi:DNA mismatch repair endonuclease MutL [Halanaeroarchaeum sulfurireducens]|uniref:DNA mismatch repair protein MutL n=1 Tax=Halanaeroarchaeum sulfurireducens TaxID=1604004 RepID=A0A0F7P6Y9_9EURY|nr:DNA mismatch repair endonuclease MutL [Halanaeroarchaeum sulfurireducens]AKH96956.1 DNA mismatch repair protein MutL [Halanaeroarchaeum sulfurireducens]ALG81357.1 DNA mismatch repair protein MutL [Halanaeroarchaeum sulfurireducens]